MRACWLGTLNSQLSTLNQGERMAVARRNKVRIRLRAFDHRILDQSAEKIVDTARRTGARIAGPVLLPTEKDIICVNRGTTIDKEAMEHFEMRTHNRLIDILEPGPT